MKIRNAILAAALAMPALAGTEAPIIETVAPTPAAKKLSGSLTVGYDSNYTGRGYVVSHSVAQGDSVVYTALKSNYDIGKPGCWSIDSTIAYKIPTSGHTLYGGSVKAAQPMPIAPGVVAPAGTSIPIPVKNIENEFDVLTAVKYSSPTEKWNVSFGHQFTHGGLLGVMAKHYRDQGASVINEVYVAPEWTPYKWLSMGLQTNYSFQGIQGWWFQPYLTVKAPIIGTPEDLTLLGVVTVGASFTYGYFDEAYEACANGCQAVWIKLSTPWFVKDNFIITPSVSFNWLGDGGQKANKVSATRPINPNAIPFRNFGVVAGVSATYTF